MFLPPGILQELLSLSVVSKDKGVAAASLTVVPLNALTFKALTVLTQDINRGAWACVFT